ncbi:MAG: PIN domain-containing protein [Caldilineaceae bacterium]|nr:PIN domain-containing protein [Caldilineaceae bacterium]
MSEPQENTSCFIDTNVWLYAFIASQDERKSNLANKLIQKSRSTIVSVQVINEVCANLVKREQFTPAQTRDVISDFYATCVVVGQDEIVLIMATELRERYSLSYWDSLIVASAIISGATTLYSEDLHDGLVIDQKLTVMNPFK